MAGHDALSHSLGQLVEVGLIFERSKSGCGWVWAVASLSDGMTAAAHTSGNDLTTLMQGRLGLANRG
jgi:hypothetical protein